VINFKLNILKIYKFRFHLLGLGDIVEFKISIEFYYYF